jgi:uncharacterized coiled-coil protein SlyX
MKDNSRGWNRHHVPSSVGGDDILTPTSSNRKETKQIENIKPLLSIQTGSHLPDNEIHEVDAYENPTELFQWINYGNYPGATQRVLDHPIEARTWIVSRVKSSGKNKALHPEVKWRFLPLHLICLKQNPSEQLLRALLFSYPQATRERDHDGNLPLHYLLAEGCNHNDLLQLILEAYPESIQKRDSKDRSPLEIVSESFRLGRITKDCMVQMLSVLRQWTINEDRSGPRSQNIIRRTSLRGSGTETRDQPDSPFVSFSFDLNENSTSKAMVVYPDNHEYGNVGQRRSRSKSRGRHDSDAEDDTPRSKPKSSARSKSSLRNQSGYTSVEMKLEEVMTERNVLREMVAQLKTQTSHQEMALLALNKQVADTASDLGKGREKMRRKKEQIEDLQIQLKERDEMIAEYKEALNMMKKERKAMNDQLTKKDATHKEEIEQLKKISADSDKRNLDERERLKTIIQSLEDEGRSEKENTVKPGEDEAVKADAAASQSRLTARIASLERELLDVSGANVGEALSMRTSDVTKLEEERDALRMMNEALESHTTALKDRLAFVQQENEQKEALRDQVQCLEKDLLALRTKHSATTGALDEIKSKFLIKESKLQTKIAKMERDLLEQVTARDAQLREATSAALWDSQQDEEEKKSVQLMNETLNDHIRALKEKCQIMEMSYSELKKQNAELTEELANVRIRGNSVNADQGIGNRQRELMLEINDLMSCIHRLKQDGIKNPESQSKIANLQASIEVLQTVLQKLQSQNEALRKEVAELQSNRMDGVPFGAVGGVSAMQLAKQAESYKQQLQDLKAKFDLLTSNNVNLREIVTKNNGTYIQKVETLSREITEVTNVNLSLHQHVRHLSEENKQLQESLAMSNNGTAYHTRLGELSNRLNQVAAFLIALSSLQRQQAELVVTNTDECRNDSFEMARGHWNAAQADIRIHEEAMLRGAGIDREEILRHADECEDELRNVDFEKSRDDLHASFDFHRDELRAISMELGKHL